MCRRSGRGLLNLGAADLRFWGHGPVARRWSRGLQGFLMLPPPRQSPTMPPGYRCGSSREPRLEPEVCLSGPHRKRARETHDVVTAVVHFDSTTRTIIDGREFGFCKLVADRKTSKVLGCHVVGERAVDIVQVAAIAIAAGMQVDDLARVPLSFPTYAGILVNGAASAARQLNLEVSWQAHQAESI